MKTLANILRKGSYSSYRAEEGLALPDAIYTGPVRLYGQQMAPMKGSDFLCPDCKGREAFVCPCVHGGRYLACVNFCESKHRKKLPPPKPPPLTCADVGSSAQYRDSSLSDIDFSNEEAVAYLVECAKSGRGQILLSGANGVGKTHAACAALNEALRRGKGGFFVSVSSFYTEWINYVKSKDVNFNTLDKLLQRDFVVIDDLGITSQADNFIDYLYNIIDARSNRMHDIATIYTTNLTGHEMELKLGRAVLSRLMGGKCFAIKGNDRRVKYAF